MNEYKEQTMEQVDAIPQCVGYNANDMQQVLDTLNKLVVSGAGNIMKLAEVFSILSSPKYKFNADVQESIE